MLRREEVGEALDEALSNLLRGESVQACLSRHRELAPEVAPLLTLAQALRRLAAGRPDPTPHLAAARERFLRLALQMRATRTPPARRAHL